MENVTLFPQYGYGWRINGTLIDTPPPFEMKIIDETPPSEPDKIIIGVVQQRNHLLDKKYLSLWLRTRADDETVFTVLIHKKEPVLEDIVAQKKASPAYGEGYVMF